MTLHANANPMFYSLKYASKIGLERDIGNCQKYLNLKFNEFNVPAATATSTKEKQ